MRFATSLRAPIQIVVLGLLTWATGAVTAQEAQSATAERLASQSAPPPPSLEFLSETVAFQRDSVADGDWILAGQQWSARGVNGAVHFGTSLSAKSLSLRPLAVQRSGWESALNSNEVVGHTDERLSRPVAAGITERWDYSAAGLELSYRFNDPLPGTGELVVRLAVETELEATPGRSSAGLLFRGSEGDVRIGTVQGIDAHGRTAAGELRFDGQHLDLCLPANFMEAAAYPLVLDPLISSIITVSKGAIDTDAGMAYDASTNTWFAVWNRRYSYSKHLTMGQRISGDGFLIGSALSLHWALSITSTRPVVANVGPNNMFVCASLQDTGSGPQLTTLGISAATGAVSTPTVHLLPTSTGNPNYLDIGGSSTTANASVAMTTDLGGVLLQPLSVTTDLHVFPSFDPWVLHSPSSTADAVDVAISSGVGELSVMYMAWITKQGSTHTLTHLALHGNGLLATGPQTALMSFSGGGFSKVSCAISDLYFTLAYVVPGAGDEIWARRYALNATATSLVQQAVQLVHSSSFFFTIKDLDIEATHTGHAVLWREEGWSSLLRFISLDLLTLDACESPSVIANGFIGPRPRLFALRSSDEAVPSQPNTAGVVWTGTTNSGVRAALVGTCP